MRAVRFWLYAKVVLFLLLIPGTVVVYLPRAILMAYAWPGVQISLPGALAVLPGAAGVAAVLLCVWDFACHGGGTPAPVDPPKVLVVRRLYRYTRNPMYLGIIAVLASESVFFRSVPLLLYGIAVSAGFHLFVLFHEEPHLSAEFGEEYARYRRAIPRWGISRRPFQ